MTYCLANMKLTLVARRWKGVRIPLDSEPPISVAGDLPPQLSPIVGEGDCFIVISKRGKCWNGEKWLSSWCEGLQFRRPEPAYELCAAAAREAEQITGEGGMVCYIPSGTPASFVLVPIPDLSQVDLRDFARKPEVC